jgi:PAS domain S-box-containing protein
MDPKARAADMIVLITWLGAVIGLLSTVVHYLNGNVERARFTAAVVIPILATPLVLRWTGKNRLAVHYLCAVFTAGILASPAFAENAPPLLVGLIGIPLAAVALGGSEVGLVWSVIAIVVVGTEAVSLSGDPVFGTVAWTIAIVTSICSIAAVLTERSRERTIRELQVARERAEFDARTRAAAEQALRESQRLVATAFQRTPAMLVVTEFESGEILEVNESFSQITGWSADEVLGRTLAEIGAWQNRHDQKSFRQAVSDHGSVQNMELELLTKSGIYVSHLVSAELIEIGGRSCLVSQAVDITERKRTEEALERARAELEARVEERSEQLRASLVRLEEQQRLVAVGTLAAGIAHQINNPIGGIAAAAEYALLARGDANAAEVHADALETILDEARRCGEIVRSVLRFARHEPTKKWVEDLNPTVASVSQRARDYVHRRGGRLDLKLTNEILPVRMNPIDIEQVVMNLVRNAAESSKEGVNVEVETRRVGHEARICVTDDGAGIDPQLLTRIMEPFFTTRLAEGGSGLGLSVVHGIIIDHAGQLDVESNIGSGTRLIVRLPLWTGGPPESTAGAVADRQHGGA